MFEFHGWAVLRWHDSLPGSQEQRLAIRQAVEGACSEFSTGELSLSGNDLTVVRLALGQLTELADPFLSPCVPTIEPPYDPQRDL